MMSHHITNLYSSLTYHLRNITRICRFFDTDSRHHVLRAIVSPGFANAILLGSNETRTSASSKLVCHTHLPSSQIWSCNSFHTRIPLAYHQQHNHFQNACHCLQVFEWTGTLIPEVQVVSIYSSGHSGLRSSNNITRLTEHRILPRNLQSADFFLCCVLFVLFVCLFVFCLKALTEKH